MYIYVIYFELKSYTHTYTYIYVYIYSTCIYTYIYIFKKIDSLCGVTHPCPWVNSAIIENRCARAPAAQHEHLHSEMIGYCTGIHVQNFCLRKPWQYQRRKVLVTDLTGLQDMPSGKEHERSLKQFPSLM